MMIHEITPSVDWLNPLITQQNEPDNQVSMKVPKVVKPTNRKTSL